MKNGLGWLGVSKLSLGLAGAIATAMAATGCGVEAGPEGAPTIDSPAPVEQRAAAVTLGQARTQGQAFVLGGRLTLTWIDNYYPQTGYTGPGHLWDVQINDANGALYTQPRMLINDTHTQNYPRAAVRTTNGTQALVAYENAVPGATGLNLKGLFLDANGAASGAAMDLHVNTGSGDHFPRTIFDPSTGSYLVAFQGGDNWTRGVLVGQTGTVSSNFSMGVATQGFNTDIDILPAAGTVGVVQQGSLGSVGNQFLSYAMLPTTTFVNTVGTNGAGRLATKVMFDAFTGKLGVLGLTYSAPTVFAAYLQTMPYTQCTTTSSCPQTSALAGTSISTVGQNAPYAAQLDMRAFASISMGGRFLVARRGLATNQVSGPPPQGAPLEIRSFDTNGVQQNISYPTSSCGVRELMGFGNGPTAAWLFWSCANGEIRGFKVSPIAVVMSPEQVIVP